MEEGEVKGRNALHGEHRVDQESQPPHLDPSFHPVYVDLHRPRIILQEALDVLEDAVLGFQEIDPGQQI